MHAAGRKILGFVFLGIFAGVAHAGLTPSQVAEELRVCHLLLRNPLERTSVLQRIEKLARTLETQDSFDAEVTPKPKQISLATSSPRYFAPISVDELAGKIEALLETNQFLDYPTLTPQVISDLAEKLEITVDSLNTDTDEGHTPGLRGVIGYHEAANGLPTHLGVATGGDSEIPVFFILYWDGEQVRGYVPTEGNAWNTTTALPYGVNHVADAQNLRLRFPEKFRSLSNTELKRAAGSPGYNLIDVDPELVRKDIAANLLPLPKAAAKIQPPKKAKTGPKKNAATASAGSQRKRFFDPIDAKELETKVTEMLSASNNRLSELPKKVREDLGKIDFADDTLVYIQAEGNSHEPLVFGPAPKGLGMQNLEGGLNYFGVLLGGRNGCAVYAIFYWTKKDGLRAYVPTEGNLWNLTTRRPYGFDTGEDYDDMALRAPEGFGPEAYEGYSGRADILDSFENMFDETMRLEPAELKKDIAGRFAPRTP